jgi:hypothetical protein
MTVPIPEQLGAFWLLRRRDTNSFSRISFAWLGFRVARLVGFGSADDELMMVAMMMSHFVSQFLH